MPMRCPSCGHQNREGRKFCSECAAALEVRCQSCQTLNEPGEKFCGERVALRGESGNRRQQLPLQPSQAPPSDSSRGGCATGRRIWAEEELKEIFGRDVDLVEKKAIMNPFRRHHILSNHEVIYAV